MHDGTASVIETGSEQQGKRKRKPFLSKHLKEFSDRAVGWNAWEQYGASVVCMACLHVENREGRAVMSWLTGI